MNVFIFKFWRIGVCGLWVLGRSAERIGAGGKIINNIIGKK